LKENNEKQPMKERQKESGEVTRRDFLVGTGAVVVGGAIAVSGIVASANSGNKQVYTTVTQTTTPVVSTVVTQTITSEGAAVVNPGETGSGIQPAMEPEKIVVEHMGYQFFCCDVKNGKVIRQRPLPCAGPDSPFPDIKPWKLEGRGKSMDIPSTMPLTPIALPYRKRLTSPNRVLYPLKRVDWEPGGDPAKINAHNRGISKYKRISWDEAASMIASEMKRIADKYGTEALCSIRKITHGENHIMHGHAKTTNAFLQYWCWKTYGTYPSDIQWEGISRIGGFLGGRYVLGEDYEATTNLFGSIADNCEMIMSWGGDTLGKYWWKEIGMVGSMVNWFYGEMGIKRIYITSDLNDGAANYADKWIPIMPNTDCALMLAIAYIWITEDIFNKEYVDTHVTGYDKWKDYVMSKEADGSLHTAEWASGITGIPEWTIKALAREWASKVTSLNYCYAGGGISRGRYCHESARMQYILMGMQGWGEPGRHIANTMYEFGRAPFMPSHGGVLAETRMLNQLTNESGKRLSDIDRDRQFFGVEHCADIYLQDRMPFNYYYTNDAFYRRTFPLEGKSTVHFEWSYTHSAEYGYEFDHVKAFQSPLLECQVQNCIWMENQAMYSDIILPICTTYELEDILSATKTSPWIIYQQEPQAVERVGESKPDFEAVMEVAKKLGIYDAITPNEVTEDLFKKGYEGSGIKDLISYDELKEKQYFVQAPDDAWRTTKPILTRFYEDPVKNPLYTPTGKLEFESQLLLQNFPDDKERPPVPHFVRGGPKSAGWKHDEDHQTSARAKDYPMLLVTSVASWHYHSGGQDIPSLREIDKRRAWDNYWYRPVWINPDDAAARGIVTGDIVKVFNDRGAIMGIAEVCQRTQVGVASMDKAAGSDMIIPGELCRGGTTNFISPQNGQSNNTVGHIVTGFLIDIEKVTGDQMQEWQRDYPEAFERPYDQAYGCMSSGWIVKEGGI
jgi:trimethylamine-N-oxide reductase (cytochrome c)